MTTLVQATDLVRTIEAIEALGLDPRITLDEVNRDLAVIDAAIVPGSRWDSERGRAVLCFTVRWELEARGIEWRGDVEPTS